MDSFQQAANPQSSGISAALDRLWERFLPEITGRVALIESAAIALRDGIPNSAQQEAAQAAAHKLAGVLGSFGLAQGTDLARKAELLLAERETPGRIEPAELLRLAVGLRALVESRGAPTNPTD
jgi:HPt (histidine-containing phosphotransfer) domain-containing protein